MPGQTKQTDNAEDYSVIYDDQIGSVSNSKSLNSIMSLYIEPGSILQKLKKSASSVLLVFPAVIQI